MTDPLISLELASTAGGPLVYAAISHSDSVRETPAHRHARGQLLGATQGLLSVDGGRLAEVILDEIRLLPQVELGLPMPQDARLLKIAQALSDRPDDERHMQAWAQWAGIAPRTLTRRFVAETGFSFTEWRQRVRLLRGLELLAAGKPVTAIALDLGYDNVSAFIALFRRTFGMTPGQYAAAMR